MTHFYARCVSRLILILGLLSSIFVCEKNIANGIWPFDQRQIALVKRADKSFPNEMTTATILDFFVKRGRVRWILQSAGKSQVLPVEIPVDFSWHSSQSIRNLGLKWKADGILLLVQKGVQIDLSWFSTSDGEPLFYESTSLPDSNGSVEQEKIRRERLLIWLSDIWSRIPGSGYVIKRDLKSLYIEGAVQNSLKVGDRLRFKRLEKMERHPVLKTVIGMNSSMTGVGKIASIESSTAVVDIEYESQIDPIQEGDRYETLSATEKAEFRAGPLNSNSAELKMIDQDDGRKYVPLFGQPADSQDANTKNSDSQEAEYKILDLTAYLTYGKLSHSDTVASEVKSMSTLTPGFRLNLKGYVTREILLLTDVDYVYAKFSGQSTNYGVDTLSSGLTSFRLAGAYRYIFLEDDFHPGEIDTHFGFRRLGLAMGSGSADDSPTAKSYSGWDLGINVILPVVPRYAGYFKFSKLFLSSLTETPLTSAENSSENVWQFEAGAKYRYTPTTELMAGILFDSASSTFDGAGTRATASTQFSLSTMQFQLGGTFKY